MDAMSAAAYSMRTNIVIAMIKVLTKRERERAESIGREPYYNIHHHF